MHEFLIIVQRLSVMDVLDILILAVLVYNLFLLIKGTRAMQMVTGILVLLAAYYLANLLGLRAFRTFLEGVLFYFPFAVIVLFQSELRKALASFARNPFSARRGARQELAQTITSIVKASLTLASKSIGALIVIECRHSLKQYTETGVLLHAHVSYDLLVNIFTPNTPLHDGALIIRDHTAIAASCFLPLTQNPSLTQEFGSRHRAAIGITEETDALAIVVSEETGAISFAVNGHLQRHLDGRSLRDLVTRYLDGSSPS